MIKKLFLTISILTGSLLLIAASGHLEATQHSAETPLPNQKIVSPLTTAPSSIKVEKAPSAAGLHHSEKPRAMPWFWDKVAQCETGANWQDTGRYGGGLGIYNNGTYGDSDMGTWERWGGEEFAPSPDKATKEQQIIVADRVSTQGWRQPDGKFKDPVGFLGWGCIRSKSTGKMRMSMPVLYYYNPWQILEVQYQFNQKGIIVSDLQKFLRMQIVDGHYGVKTRERHLAYLQKNSRSTLGVPALPDYLKYAVPDNNKQTCPEYEGKFRKYGLEPWATFSHIAWRESRCQSQAISKKNADGTQDYGLLQINSSWKTVTANICRSKYGDMKALLDVTCNIKVAKYLYETPGGAENWKQN